MIAYLDIPSGLSGDMMLGCLVDGGWPFADLKAFLARLDLPGEEYQLGVSDVQRGPLRATLVDVQVRETKHHRTLPDIRAVLDRSDIPQSVRDGAWGVFNRLAQGEAKVHGMPVEKVHFHEVGAVDAIVDIVGTSAGLHALGIERLYASPAPLGAGWITAAHGALPLPAPAVLEILAGCKAPTRPAPGPGELVTPTGAAILAHFATFGQPEIQLHRIGIGAGQKQFSWPNIARLWLGETIGKGQTGGSMVQIETNIDDMNPQLYASVSDKLFDLGAKDVWLTPVQMKKGRPGIVLSVLAPTAQETVLADAMLRQTTTLGVRVSSVHRHEAQREIQTVQTVYGPIQVKIKRLGEETIGAVPEFEDCRRAGQSFNVPVRLVEEAASAEAQRIFITKPSSTV